MKRSLIDTSKAASCYFRTSTNYPYRKALLQITEQCNLSCVHCFVSAGRYGKMMTLGEVELYIIPKLIACRVVTVSITGGEPFFHPQLLEIVEAFRKKNIKVTLCTNATLITEEQIRFFRKCGGITINVSLDGFSENSHGVFRGNKKSFTITRKMISLLGKNKLLKGLLVTPNKLVALTEYIELCEFAIDSGAKYILMNPLSYFGRGVQSKKALGVTQVEMNEIRNHTKPYLSHIELSYIRFPSKTLPLSGCEAGNIIYIFSNGAIAICPYLVFAAQNSNSKYNYEEFIIGNIFKDIDIAKKLDKYDFQEKYKFGDNPTCNSCSMNPECGKGCPAAIITAGESIGKVDKEVCPII